MKLTATTPFGTFTRTTEHPYTHVAVMQFQRPRQIDPRDREIKVASWSRTAAGATKLGNQQAARYPQSGAFLGVFPVDGRA
jgi:hypothetical protein